MYFPKIIFSIYCNFHNHNFTKFNNFPKIIILPKLRNRVKVNLVNGSGQSGTHEDPPRVSVLGHGQRFGQRQPRPPWGPAGSRDHTEPRGLTSVMLGLRSRTDPGMPLGLPGEHGQVLGHTRELRSGAPRTARACSVMSYGHPGEHARETGSARAMPELTRCRREAPRPCEGHAVHARSSEDVRSCSEAARVRARVYASSCSLVSGHVQSRPQHVTALRPLFRDVAAQAACWVVRSARAKPGCAGLVDARLTRPGGRCSDCVDHRRSSTLGG